MPTIVFGAVVRLRRRIAVRGRLDLPTNPIPREAHQWGLAWAIKCPTKRFRGISRCWMRNSLTGFAAHIKNGRHYLARRTHCSTLTQTDTPAIPCRMQMISRHSIICDARSIDPDGGRL